MLRSRLVSWHLAVAVAALLTACGEDGSSSGGGGTPGDGTSGIDVGTYPASATAGSAGAVVTLPGGPTLNVPAGVLTTTAEIGLRPADSPPSTPSGWTAASGWYDVGVTRADLPGSTTVPFEIRIPVTPPEGSVGHPGLQALARVRSLIVPIDGTYDAASGTFVVKLVSLPPEFTFCVAFNPNVKRLDSAGLASSYALHSAKTSALGGAWSTVDWVIDYDGQTMTDDEAKQVLRWGARAAQAYSDVGFKEPFLYRELLPVGGERWHVHLIASGSHFNGNADTSDADVARHFGRINLAVDDARQPTTNSYGGGYSIFAHEMFHSIFASYGIGATCFNYTENGTTWCYESTSGYNEGLATTVGYLLEQGATKPRPDLTPAPLERPLGWFDSGDQGAAYQNQDFFIFLLRMGSLETVRQTLIALATAKMGVPTSAAEALTPYAEALEATGIGFPGPFHELYATYVADRSYVRDENGWIWPDEPAPESPGARNTWAPSLFPNAYTLGAGDCKTTDVDAICTVTLKDVPAFGTRALLAQFTDTSALPAGFNMAAMTVKFAATTTTGQVSFSLFAEKDGLGADEGRLGSFDGKEVALKDVGSKWTDGKMVVVHGAGAPSDLVVTMTFTTSDLSDVCQATADWMCKCQAGGAGYGCMVYQASVNQICANIPPDQDCDSTCMAMGESYIEAYSAEDPSMWNAMCPNAPR